MPYLGWDKYSNAGAPVASSLIDSSDGHGPNGRYYRVITLDEYSNINTLTVPNSSANNQEGENPNDGYHMTRTLDECFYPGLWDMSTRNAGQTVSKWTSDGTIQEKDGLSEASSGSMVLMVHQLWIWYLEDGE